MILRRILRIFKTFRIENKQQIEMTPGKLDKIKKKQKKTICTKPRTATDCSANWKKLFEELNAEKLSNPPNSVPIRKRQKFNPKKQNDPKVWFDGVSKADLNAAEGADKQSLAKINLSKKGEITKVLGLDCEMVGIGFNARKSNLARITIVNDKCECVYDKFVKPTEKVTDYRTKYSGIRPENLANAEEFTAVQQEVADIIKDKIIVGHALENDFKALMLMHPKSHIRDTATYQHLRDITGKTKKSSLKFLTKNILGIDIQTSEHCPLEDSISAMKLYLMHKKQWENYLRSKK